MSAAGVVLFPGAGTAADHPSLVTVEAEVRARRGLPVERCDFPYRRAGRRAPDRAPVLVDAVIAEARRVAGGIGADTDRLVLGGRSMGGRMCSMAAAGDPATGRAPLAVAALVLICYPLHPPGKPDALRVEHLPRLTVPVLFVSGTRDAFGSPDELEAWTSTIPGPVTHHWIDRAGHDLRGHDHEVAQVIADWLPAG